MRDTRKLKSEIEAVMAAFLLFAVQTGLRLSEMTSLCRPDVIWGSGTHVRYVGKGRKEGCTRLTKQAVDALKLWLREPRRGTGDILFPSARGTRLSADGVQFLAKHVALARQMCPSLKNKRVTPHVLRHSYATSMLEAGVDIISIQHLLGHSSLSTTLIYLHCRRPYLETLSSPLDWLPVTQCPRVIPPLPESPKLPESPPLPE